MKRLVALAFLLTLLPLATKADERITLCPAVQSMNPPEEFKNLKMMRAGADGWLFALRDLRRAPALDETSRTQLARLVQHLSANNTKLVVALVPNRILTSYTYLTPEITAEMPHKLEDIRSSYFAKLASIAATGALVPDLLSPLENDRSAQNAGLFFKRDHHWTPTGSRIAASALAQAMLTLPEVTDISDHTFASSIAAARQNTGSYAEYAQKICGTTLAAEPYDYYRTTRAEPASLLDETTPSIVLAGTSFSSDRFNFSGFLSEGLSREVQNVSVDGGGIDNSLATYLASSAFTQQRPRVLVWEVPALYLFDKPAMWRQLVPAAGPVCSDVTALATATSTLAGETKLLGDFDLKVNPGVDFLYLESSDAGLVRFSLRFMYIDGKSETVALERSTRAKNNGHYFMELSRTHSTNLRSVTLIPEGMSHGTIMARICPGMP